MHGLTRLIGMFHAVKLATVVDHATMLQFPVPDLKLSSNSDDDMYHAWCAGNNQLSVQRLIPPLPKNAEPAYIPQNPNEANYGIYNLGLYI